MLCAILAWNALIPAISVSYIKAFIEKLKDTDVDAGEPSKAKRVRRAPGSEVAFGSRHVHELPIMRADE
jgi:hypothetical protein